MLPTYLIGSYQQYKADTDHIATWLANTAKECGYAVADMTTNVPVEKPKKLKGRARMLAKAAVKAGKPYPSVMTKQPTHTIAVKDFLPLAQYIAAHDKPPVSIPRTFVSALDRAIALRKRVSDAVENQSECPDGETPDTGHSFFVRVLESVRGTLKPRMPTELPQESVTHVTPSASKDRLANMFTSLQVEEPSEEFINSPSEPKQSAGTSNGKPDGKPDGCATAQDFNDLKEALFAFSCLFHDLYNIRDIIIGIWKDFKSGRCDLTVASITTNTGLELARRLEEDLEPAFAKYGGSRRMVEIFYWGHCIKKGQDPKYTERPTDDMNFAMFEIASTFFWPISQIYESYIISLERNWLHPYRPGLHGFYDPSVERSKLSSREQYQEDKIILCEILPDFTALALMEPRGPWEDEYTKALRKAFQMKDNPFSVLFDGQVFLDIHHILRDQVGLGFELLCQTGDAISQSIYQHLEFHKNVRSDDWPMSKTKCFHLLLQDIDIICHNDVVREARMSLTGEWTNAIEAHRFLKCHPVACGLRAYYIKAIFQRLCVDFANSWGAILFTGHLYNAMKQEKLLQGIWKDMELLFFVQNVAHLFAGGPPTSAENYFRRFCLAVGYSARNFARNKRPQKLPAASRAGPRRLEEHSPVSRMFFQRFCTGADQAEMTVQDVEKILTKGNCFWFETVGEKGEPEMLITHQRPWTAKPQFQNQWDKSSQLSPRQLLFALRLSLHNEMVEFSYDYLTMHRQCLRLLLAIQKDCVPLMCEIFGPECPDEIEEVGFLVGYIFKSMMAEEKVVEQIPLLPRRKSFRKPSCELLEVAARCANAMLMAQAGGADSNAGGINSHLLRTVFHIALNPEVTRKMMAWRKSGLKGRGEEEDGDLDRADDMGKDSNLEKEGDLEKGDLEKEGDLEENWAQKLVRRNWD